MFVKVTSKRQVTFPAEVLDAIGAEPGSLLELQPQDEGFLLKVRRIDQSKLAPLAHLVSPDTEPFDIAKFRDITYDPSLRD